MKYSFLILALSKLIFAADPILPELPPHYQTNIQVNVINKLRDNPGYPIAPEGQSLHLFEAVDDDNSKALLRYTAGKGWHFNKWIVCLFELMAVNLDPP